MSVEQKDGVFVFFSYAPRDKLLRDRLEEHLSNLKYRGLITTWYDRQILAGEDWLKQVDEALEKAQIILLLISSTFMASDYCYGKEMQQALRLHEQKKAAVIPVLLRPVVVTGAPFTHLAMLPSNQRPVTTWRDRDSAFVNVALGIERVAERYTLRTGTSSITQFESDPELHPFSREDDPGSPFQLPSTNHSSLPTQLLPSINRPGWRILSRRWLVGLLALLVIVSSILTLGLFALYQHHAVVIPTPTVIVGRPTVTPTSTTGLQLPFVSSSSAIFWILLLLLLFCLLAIGGIALFLRRRRRLKRQSGQTFLKNADDVFLKLLTERVSVASFDAEEEQKRYYNRQNLRIYQKALYSNPDDERAWLGLGRTFEGLGFYQKALEIFQYSIKYWPSAAAYAQAGHAALQLGRYHEAVSFYKRALASDPHVSLAYAGYIQALQRLGRAGEADQVQMRARALGYLDEEQE